MKRWVSRLALGLYFTGVFAAGTADAQPAGGASVAVTPAAADAELSDVEKRAKSYAFRGSSIAWWQSLSALAFNPGAELTYNPSYSWTFRFWPKYNFTDKLSMKLKVDLNVELTNSDDTTKQRETQLGDMWQIGRVHV